MSKIFNLSEARKVETPGVSKTYWLVDKEVGATKMSAVMYEYEPNVRLTRVHYHVNRESAYLILEGEARIHLNGKDHVLGPNNVVYLAPGDIHGIVGTGSEGLRIIEVWSPVDRDIVYPEEGNEAK